MKFKISQIINFLQYDIWRIRSKQLSGPKSFMIRNLRVILLGVRGFAEDKCQLRASALTFYSLLSIVPVIAMAFGIAKGFGFEKRLEQQLLASVQGQEGVLLRVIEFAKNMLENTQGGIVAGVGVAVLFWSVIKVLGQIESSFNDIWGIKQSRSMARRFADYLSIMLICPVLMITASSVNVVITSQVTLLMSKLSFLGPVADMILLSLKILPYVVLWIVFTFLYIFMPNTKVNFRSAAVAGVLAGTIYQIVQALYIMFQVGASRYGAIYGSFAALPLFLVWLQVSWLIVLLGAEISFADQNVDTYEFEPDSHKASRAFRRLVALAVTHGAVKRFCHGEAPQTADTISHELEVPIRLLRDVLFELSEAGVLAEVRMDDEETIGYQPAFDVEDITIQSVMDKLDHHGEDNLPLVDSQEVKTFTQHMVTFSDAVAHLSENKKLKDI